MVHAMLITAKFKPQYNLTSERHEDVLYGNLKPHYSMAITKLVGHFWSLKSLQMCLCWDSDTLSINQVPKIQHSQLKTRERVSITLDSSSALTLTVLHSSTVASTTASNTGNGLTKTCPERCVSWVRNPAHPPRPRHTVGGPMPLGMGLLPSPPFTERDKGVVTRGKASQERPVSQHTNIHTE